MIYFDNAATSRPKPEIVYDAYNYYVREIGTSPGRGSYSLAVQASRMLYLARKTVASFFGIPKASNVIFTKNSTEAINFFFDGYLNKGDHVIISPYEHNAVLRPLHTLKNKSVIDYAILPESVIYKEPENICNYIKPNTKLLVLTLASNLTGQIVFNSNLSKIAHELGVKVFVDSSQGAGKKLINMSRDFIDFMAFTGHKDLFSLPGVGGLLSLEDISIPPLIQGGTGIYGDEYVNPNVFPDSYEAGTPNMPSIWSLKVAIEYIEENLKSLRKEEKELMSYMFANINELNNIVIYNKSYARVPTFCFNIKNKLSNDVVEILDKNGICVRGGIHCTILAHQTLGTVETGAVRVSINAFNNKSEIDDFIKVIGEIR